MEKCQACFTEMESGGARELDWWVRVGPFCLSTLRLSYGTWPSFVPARAGPPSPQGKALGGTMYHRKVQHFKFERRSESLPRGGRWTRSGRMRAACRKQSVVYQRNTTPCGTTNQIHPALPDTIIPPTPIPPAPSRRWSGACGWPWRGRRRRHRVCGRSP